MQPARGDDRRNTAIVGAGIESTEGGLTLVGTTVRDNTAVGAGARGGGIDAGGVTTLDHVTITDNHSSNGGGLYREAGITTAQLNIKNTIITANTAVTFADIGPDFTDQGHNLIGVAAGLGPLADNGGPTRTHALLAGSAAIDAGDPADPLTHDQRFLDRPADGDLTVEAMQMITAATADGTSSVTLFSAEASMTAMLAVDTFASAVAFSVTRLDPATLPSDPGQDASGAAAMIDPLAAYQFDFAVPTLGQLATLTFEIDVAALGESDRAAFLTALAAGNASVAVKNDDPSPAAPGYQAFALCGPGQTPAADACVTVTQLDADHNPITSGEPAFVRFDGVTGHFSTFAVVTVASQDTTGPTIEAMSLVLNARRKKVTAIVLTFSEQLTELGAEDLQTTS